MTETISTESRSGASLHGKSYRSFINKLIIPIMLFDTNQKWVFVCENSTSYRFVLIIILNLFIDSLIV